MIKFSRRDFLRLVGAGTAAAGLAELGRRTPIFSALAPTDQPQVPLGERTVAGICRLCAGGCGITARVIDGRVVKLDGNPLHPNNQGRLCPKGQAGLQVLYDPDRIKGPMRRVEDRGWQQISWDEAFDIVEKRLKEIRDTHGAESVLFLKGTGRDIGAQIQLLSFAYGSPNVVFGLSGIACYAPRGMVMWATQYDLRRSAAQILT